MTDPRPQGVYAVWTDHPPQAPAARLLVIERVCGRMTFARMVLTSDEADTVAAAIAEERAAC